MIIKYVDASGIRSDHPVRPLVLKFWGRVCTLATWCEARQDFRSFRVDRIEALRPTGETISDEPGTTLADWRRLHGGWVADTVNGTEVLRAQRQKEDARKTGRRPQTYPLTL